jgi:hypothetical protein
LNSGNAFFVRESGSGNQLFFSKPDLFGRLNRLPREVKMVKTVPSRLYRFGHVAFNYG